MCDLKEIPESGLASIHSEMGAEMRWRRDTEYKLLTIYFAISGVALVQLIHPKEEGPTPRWVISSAVIFIAVVLRSLIAAKIKTEHIKHVEAGKIVSDVRRRWSMYERTKNGLPRLLSSEMETVGAGCGYEKTIEILNWCCWIVGSLAFLSATPWQTVEQWLAGILRTLVNL